MATKLPLVLNSDGTLERLQSGDILTGWEPVSPTEGDILKYGSEGPIWDSTLPSGSVGEYEVLTWVGNEWVWIKSARIIAETTDLYVATGGDDTTGDGTQGNPWATIDKAMSVVNGWMLQSHVNINVEKGVYTTSPENSILTLNHSQGGMLSIKGEYHNETATLTGTNNAGSYVDYTITAVDGSEYTVGDCVLVYKASGGSNPQYMLGTLTVQSVSGNTVVLRHPTATATAATGAVSVYVSVPQVKWNRRLYIYSPIRLIEGIQTHYNFTDHSLFVYANSENPTNLFFSNCIFNNTNAGRYGQINLQRNSFTYMYKCGIRNIHYTIVGTALGKFEYTGCTNCNYGFYAYMGSTITLAYTHNVGITNTALTAMYMSLFGVDALPNEILNCGIAASPSKDSSGNTNCWMTY